MKIKFKTIEIYISDTWEIFWEFDNKKFSVSMKNSQFYLSESRNNNFYIISMEKIIFFDFESSIVKEIYNAEYELELLQHDNTGIYLSDNTKLIKISLYGNIEWIYWHYDLIENIDFLYNGIEPVFININHEKNIILDYSTGKIKFL